MIKFKADIGNWDSGVVRSFEAKNEEEALDIAWKLVSEVRKENPRNEEGIERIDLVQVYREDGTGPVWDYMNGWLGLSGR